MDCKQSLNADDFDCLIIYWNRFNHELVAVKKDCVYNSYPFDNDLLSHFTVVSIRAYLLEYWGIIIHNCGVEFYLCSQNQALLFQDLF